MTKGFKVHGTNGFIIMHTDDLDNFYNVFVSVQWVGLAVNNIKYLHLFASRVGPNNLTIS